LIRRKDREPDDTVRVCSCHFHDGVKAHGPEIFEWSREKLFPVEEPRAPKPKKAKQLNELPSCSKSEDSTQKIEPLQCDVSDVRKTEVENLILKSELESKTKELENLKDKDSTKQPLYSASNINDEVIRMETGLPNKNMFKIVVKYVESHKHVINYHSGWRVVALSIEDQVLIALMKLTQNYTNLHIGQLFGLSTRAVSNIIITFIHLLHKLLYQNCMSTVPSRVKNSTSLPESFSPFPNCRMIIDCTDIKIAAPHLMSEQKETYSSYRGMNSFKVLVGVAPNAVITFISKLFPGSVSDKVIVKESGLLDILEPGDMILADKGFLIQDIVPDGVTVNIPPFLNEGKLSDSEIKLTKSIAKCRIHVERANARLKDFKILHFIPPYLRCYSDIVVQLCAALVNLQNPLIKEVSGTVEFD